MAAMEPIADGNGLNMPNGVVKVYGLEPKQMNCDKLFNLLCLYGNVCKIKFLKTEQYTAMVQMGDSKAAERIVQYLDGSWIFGYKLKLSHLSKHAFLDDLQVSGILNDNSPSYRDYTDSRNNRFTTAYNASKNNLVAPNRKLFFFSAPPNFNEDQIDEMIKSSKLSHEPFRIKIFPPPKRQQSELRGPTGLIQFDNTREALEALMYINNTPIDNPNAKYPYVVKFSFYGYDDEDLVGPVRGSVARGCKTSRVYHNSDQLPRDRDRCVSASRVSGFGNTGPTNNTKRGGFSQKDRGGFRGAFRGNGSRGRGTGVFAKPSGGFGQTVTADQCTDKLAKCGLVSNFPLFVQVRNVRCSPATLRLYLQNPRSGGNGNGIVTLETFMPDEYRAVFKFSDVSSVQSVLRQEVHTVEEYQLYISSLPPISKNHLLISGFPSDIDPDRLCDYYGARGASSETDIEFNADRSKAVLIFGKEIDLEKLKFEAKKKPLIAFPNANLTGIPNMDTIRYPDGVILTNLPDQYHKDTLMLEIENCLCSSTKSGQSDKINFEVKYIIKSSQKGMNNLALAIFEDYRAVDFLPKSLLLESSDQKSGIQMTYTMGIKPFFDSLHSGTAFTF